MYTILTFNQSQKGLVNPKGIGESDHSKYQYITYNQVLTILK